MAIKIQNRLVESNLPDFTHPEMPTLGEDNTFVSNIPTKIFTDTPSFPGSGMLYQTRWHQQPQWITSRLALLGCKWPWQELPTTEPITWSLYIDLTCCIYIWLSFCIYMESLQIVWARVNYTRRSLAQLWKNRNFSHQITWHQR